MTQKKSLYGKAFAIFMLFIAAQFVGSAIVFFLVSSTLAMKGETIEPTELIQYPQWVGVGLFVGNLLLLIVLWATQLVRRQPLPRRRPPMPWKWGVPIGAFVLFSIGTSIALIPLDLDDGGMAKLFEGMLKSPLSIFTIAVLGPIVEELVFREGIQRHLRLAGMSQGVAIGIAAVLFGLIHGNMAQAVPAVAMGVVLGLLYERTGDVRLAAPAHIVNNSLALVLMGFPEVDAYADRFPVSILIGTGVIFCLAGFGLLWVWWQRSVQIPPSVPCR